MTDNGNVRVRFAPSPTGYLHVGGARTAIFNWLFARRHGGVFLLRVEDTDVERSTRESERSVLDDLRWLGLDWDEGPGKGGPHGPYRQSERLDLYRATAADFVSRGLAYPCFCSDEVLEEKRQAALARGVNPQYDGTCRNLSAAEVEKQRSRGIPETVRFKVPVDIVAFDDIVRGGMDLDTAMVGDFVILRSSGLPTYNFAAAHDDHHMRITHVIRGEEHLSNTLRQLLIYHAMAADPPHFAHVPLILGEDRSKLSKRHGAASVDELRARGYLPGAVRNYLALLGWSHPDEKELLPVEELIAAFDLKRINASAAIFDAKKLAWMNGQHIRMLPPEDLYALAEPYLPGWLGESYDEAKRREIVALLYDHIDTLSGLAGECEIFREEVVPDAEAAGVLSGETAKAVLQALLAELDPSRSGSDGPDTPAGGELTPDSFKAMVKQAGKAAGVKGKDLFFPVRAALTGNLHGPDLARVAAIKGRDRVRREIERALSRA